MKAIQRVYQYIHHKEVKPISFEKKVGLSNGYLGKQLKRSADLGEGVLIKIIENCPEINPEWLLTGKGNMLKDSSGIIQEFPASSDLMNMPEDSFIKKYIKSLENSNFFMSQEIERLRDK